MAAKTTHVFKKAGDVELKLELFTRNPAPKISQFNRKKPVVLFVHGGGFVAFNREHVPPHVIQSCLIRDWVPVSCDYRLLPQVKGIDQFEDVKDAYKFVREDLPQILVGRELSPEEAGPMENIILVGQSAGAYLAYAGGHHLQPPPLAILSYYGIPSVNISNLSEDKKMLHLQPKIPRDVFEKYLQEPIQTGWTPPFNVFDPDCLLPDLTRNPAYVRPDVNFDNPADRRVQLIRWLAQEEGGLGPWFEGVDTSLEDPAWREYPPTFMVHGTDDEAVPYEGSKMLTQIIGPTPARLFTAQGQSHSFDQPFYLGDEGLAAVEEAWAALEETVNAKRR